MTHYLKGRWNVIVVLLVVLALGAGCAASNEVTVTADDNNSQVQLEQGRMLVVTLASNPSTGYSWQTSELDESVLRQVGDPVFEEADQGETPLVGAAGTETFRFEPAGTGTTTLTLVYRRPWEEGVEPEETFSIQVVVRE